MTTSFPNPPGAGTPKESKESHPAFTLTQAKTTLTRLHAAQEALTHILALTQPQQAPATKNPKQQLNLLRHSLANMAQSIASILDTPTQPRGDDMVLTVLSLRLRQCETFYSMLEHVEQGVGAAGKGEMWKGEMEKREWKRKGDEVKKKLAAFLVEAMGPVVHTGICALRFRLEGSKE